jgi:hypothetical protein
VIMRALLLFKVAGIRCVVARSRFYISTKPVIDLADSALGYFCGEISFIASAADLIDIFLTMVD